MIDPELASIMNQVVRASAPGARDAYGHTAYGSSVPMQCHIVARIKEVQTRSGQLAMSTGHAILTDVYPWLTDGCKLEIPSLSSASGWRTVNIVAVITAYDEVGPHHQTVYYGDMMGGIG